MKWFDGKLLELKMIYRGTDHEFTRQSWDDLCTKKGPTLSVIQAESRRIFGGYTKSNWAKGQGSYGNWGEPDDNAWIFSFDHRS